MLLRMKFVDLFFSSRKRKKLPRIPNGFHPKSSSQKTLTMADLEQYHKIIQKKRAQKQNAQGKDV